MNIGTGCVRRTTDAKRGTKTIELWMFANDILKNHASQRIAVIANAAIAFQDAEAEAAGRLQG
jgi:hypothetical protein